MDPLATLSRHRIRNVKWTARAKRDVLFVHATQSLVEEVLSFGVVVALSWQFEETYVLGRLCSGKNVDGWTFMSRRSVFVDMSFA